MAGPTLSGAAGPPHSQVNRNLVLYLPRLTVLVNIEVDRPWAWFPGSSSPYQVKWWSRKAVGQQHNNNTPAPYVLEVRRTVAQLLLVNRAGREQELLLGET